MKSFDRRTNNPWEVLLLILFILVCGAGHVGIFIVGLLFFGWLVGGFVFFCGFFVCLGFFGSIRENCTILKGNQYFNKM